MNETLLLGEQIPAPNRQPAVQAVPDQEQLLNCPRYSFLKFPDRLFFALRGELRHAWHKAQ